MRHIKALRRAAAVLAGAAAAATALLSVTAPAHAATPASLNGGYSFSSGPWHTLNSPGSWANSPTLATDLGGGLGNNYLVYLACYYYGAAEGPYGNTVWYLAANDKATVGFINDHFLDTPGTAANPQFQTPHCASAGYGSGYQSSVLFHATGSPGVFDNSPSQADASGIPVANGDTLQLVCYYRGAPSGAYNNTLWYMAQDTTAHNGQLSYGFINDHFLDTPDTAANPVFETPHCS